MYEPEWYNISNHFYDPNGLPKMKKRLGKKQNVVKVYIKPLLPVVLGLMMVYSSCRKDEKAPVPINAPSKTLATDSISGQVAVNIARSLAGSYGGVNIMDGVDSVSLSGHLGPHHAANTQSLCGFFTDSLVNRNWTSGDTTNHTGGNLTFYFDCNNGKSTGYTAYDSLATTQTTSHGSSEHYVKQYYTIKCLDDKHTFVGVNGDIYYYSTVTIECGCHHYYTTIENANYVLSNLKVDVCKKDILSGTATFKAYGESWFLTGTITFLGNHMADIVINNQTYHVNLQTGTWNQ